MSEVQSTWRVIWNTNLYDVQSRYREGIDGSVVINQSKGRAAMRSVPLVGDGVVVVWNNHAHMRGTVIQGFTVGTNHQDDEVNLGNIREHAEPEYYAIIELRSLPVPIEVRSTGQRTWVKIGNVLEFLG
jgi:hypothetical protein